MAETNGQHHNQIYDILPQQKTIRGCIFMLSSASIFQNGQDENSRLQFLFHFMVRRKHNNQSRLLSNHWLFGHFARTTAECIQKQTVCTCRTKSVFLPEKYNKCYEVKSVKTTHYLPQFLCTHSKKIKKSKITDFVKKMSFLFLVMLPFPVLCLRTCVKCLHDWNNIWQVQNCASSRPPEKYTSFFD